MDYKKIFILVACVFVISLEKIHGQDYVVESEVILLSPPPLLRQKAYVPIIEIEPRTWTVGGTNIKVPTGNIITTTPPIDYSDRFGNKYRKHHQSILKGQETCDQHIFNHSKSIKQDKKTMVGFILIYNILHNQVQLATENTFANSDLNIAYLTKTVFKTKPEAITFLEQCIDTPAKTLQLPDNLVTSIMLFLRRDKQARYTYILDDMEQHTSL